MEAAQTIIELRNLRKDYKIRSFLGSRTVHALNGISLDVRQGEIFGLLGPNGAGKTTLIKVLLGLVRASEGQAKVFGYPAGHWEIRRRVGYLPEIFQIPTYHTAYSACRFYGRLSGMDSKQLQQRIPQVLELTGLKEWKHVLVTKFSKGMRQRLGLALALLHDPPLLILDEPTDGIDPVGRVDVRNIIRNLKQHGITIFINSHLLPETELICDRVAILHQGIVKRIAGIDELHHQHSGQVRFEVCASPESIQALFPDAKLCQSPAENTIFSLPCNGIRPLNQAIDTLRKNGIDIVTIGRESQSLEEAFLRIITEKEGNEDPDQAGGEVSS
ncbi:MAG: ABC transporter ATP-binding protein [Lentisphaerae bacterium]|nr:MAG: ABC transporter ATP-binding protein [Lentisphaerota bacterium]